MTSTLPPRGPRPVGARVAAWRDAAPSTPAGRAVETEYRPASPVDVRDSLLAHRRGPGDPTIVEDAGVLWRAARTPEGIATIAITPSRTSVRAAAWGPGAEWAIAQLPALCGAFDDASGFDATLHPLIAEAHRRNPGLRIGRTELVFEALAGSIMEQKVTGLQAFGAWRRIMQWCGERAPGPTPRPMFAPPPIDGWRAIPSWTWHRAGLEPPQSRTIVAAAARGRSIERALAEVSGGDDRDRILTSLNGVGLWTAAETRIRAFGDPDAVSVGDYHLAHEVGYALTGSRTDDDGMLELLAPWAGQRQRVIRLIGRAGVREARRGPRLHPEDHRSR